MITIRRSPRGRRAGAISRLVGFAPAPSQPIPPGPTSPAGHIDRTPGPCPVTRAGWTSANDAPFRGVDRAFPLATAAHRGQPAPSRVRLAMLARQMCVESTRHCHQTFLVEPSVTRDGLRSGFRVGCHSAATSGRWISSRLVKDTCLPAHAGQPEPTPQR